VITADFVTVDLAGFSISGNGTGRGTGDREGQYLDLNPRDRDFRRRWHKVIYVKLAVES
jgi:hypothetical protein